jgi:hypothetical protein
MQTLSNVQRNFYDKKYIKISIEVFIAFVLTSFSSTFIYFPMLIGIVLLKFDKYKVFLFSFLLFTELTHGLFISSLFFFYFIFKEFVMNFLKGKIENQFIPYLSIILIYLLYFGIIWILYYLFNIPISYDYSTIFIYYILLEILILKLLSL